MAEKTAKNDKPAGKGAAAPAPAGGEGATAKKKLPIKMFAIVAACLLIEGVAISAVFLLSGRPTDVKADHAATDAAADLDKPMELAVIADKFQNTRSGRTYLYDTEIYVVVKTRNKAKVEALFKATSAQINNDVTLIFRAAEPAHLMEPTLATLIRQIRTALDERIGKDNDGKPLVDEVVIKKFIQFRAE